LGIGPYNTPRATPNSAKNDSKIFGASDVSARLAVSCETKKHPAALGHVLALPEAPNRLKIHFC
jgi:hypothetical protein